MNKPIGFNRVKPIIDGITGVLILLVVVGLPVVGWSYHIGDENFDKVQVVTNLHQI